MVGDSSKQVKTYDLFDSLQQGSWLKLPFACMRECGPAVQTLGGLLTLIFEGKGKGNATFVAVAGIAQRAFVPLKTARKHLDTLEEHGWISNQGRQSSRRGIPRRTCTIALTEKCVKATKGDEKSYGVLPWWAASKGRPSFSWSGRALLSLIMVRLMHIKKICGEQGRTGEEWEVRDEIEANEKRRFELTLSAIAELTGLSRESIVTAKKELARHKIINWWADTKGGPNNVPHNLQPSRKFKVVIKPAGPGKCYIEFK